MRIPYLNLLRIVLGLVAFHSLVLGFSMILFAPYFLHLIGFSDSQGLFFPHQSGVFLIILGIGYSLGAKDPIGNQGLVLLTIISKGAAIIFLYYYALGKHAGIMVFLVGIGDTIMGIAVSLLAWKTYYNGIDTR